MFATLAGFGLMFAPQDHLGRVEAVVHDAALPGLRVLHRSEAWVRTLPTTITTLTSGDTSPGDADESAEPSSAQWQQQLAPLQAQIRQLQSQNAQLQTELEQVRAERGSPFVAENAAPLFVPELLNASIVAVDDVSIALQRASAQRIVDVGQSDGVVPADFVVSPQNQTEAAPRLLIDQGAPMGLHPDQPVFAGRCVVGKVQQVGRWTSSILPVTDPEFRGRAQLMRRTADGLVVGSEGIIAGDGQNGCLLKFIAATEPVSIGDEIYTAVSGTPLPMPMYYGRVTSTHLADGSPYWEITVTPAETMNHTRSVQVLRAVLNPTRTATATMPREQP